MRSRDHQGSGSAWGTFRQLDEFLRLYQVGFVAVWPLLGLACAQAWTLNAVAGLLAISASFNVFGGVLNDLCDLGSDREAPGRAQRWLVTGVVSVRLAWVVVIAQIPILLVIHLAAGFRTASLGWLVAALAGQAIYDAFGKRSRIPPLAEVGQAAAASFLVLYGATGTTGTTGTLIPLAWPTAVAGAAVLLLVNAFHGGLRDIDDDARSGVRTTPIWFGCASTVDAIRISPAMSAYASCWLALLIASSLEVASQVGRVVLAVTSAGCVINVVLFVLLHHLKKPAWDVVLRVHVALLMLPIMTAFTPLLGFGASAVLFAIYLLPVLLLTCQFARAADIRTRARHPWPAP